jgi:hypothetical protein
MILPSRSGSVEQGPSNSLGMNAEPIKTPEPEAWRPTTSTKKMRTTSRAFSWPTSSTGSNSETAKHSTPEPIMSEKKLPAP